MLKNYTVHMNLQGQIKCIKGHTMPQGFKLIRAFSENNKIEVHVRIPNFINFKHLDYKLPFSS